MASLSATRSTVLGLYRVLLRAQSQTFANDRPMQLRARAEIHRYFAGNRKLSDSAAITEAIQAGREAADYLKTSVIQARKTSEGNYGQ